MEYTATKFLDVMNEIKDIYAELTELSDQKQPAILQKDIRDLDLIVRKEQGVVLRLNQLEKQRSACVNAFAVQRGLHPDSLSLRDIAAQSPPPINQQLEEINNALSVYVEKLSQQNRVHRSLLEGKLDYVRFATHYLSAEQGGNSYNTFGGEGNEERPSTLTMIDRKV